MTRRLLSALSRSGQVQPGVTWRAVLIKSGAVSWDPTLKTAAPTLPTTEVTRMGNHSIWLLNCRWVESWDVMVGWLVVHCKFDLDFAEESSKHPPTVAVAPSQYHAHSEASV